jgi:hypothetical protein
MSAREGQMALIADFPFLQNHVVLHPHALKSLRSGDCLPRWFGFVVNLIIIIIIIISGRSPHVSLVSRE